MPKTHSGTFINMAKARQEEIIAKRIDYFKSVTVEKLLHSVTTPEWLRFLPEHFPSPEIMAAYLTAVKARCAILTNSVDNLTAEVELLRNRLAAISANQAATAGNNKESDNA